MSLLWLENEVQTLSETILEPIPRVDLLCLKDCNIGRYVDMYKAQPISVFDYPTTSDYFRGMVLQLPVCHPFIIHGDQLCFMRFTSQIIFIRMFNAYTFEFIRDRIVPFGEYTGLFKGTFEIDNVQETNNGTIWIIGSFIAGFDKIFLEVDIKKFKILRFDNTEQTNRFWFDFNRFFRHSFYEGRKINHTVSKPDDFKNNDFVEFFRTHVFNENTITNFECLLKENGSQHLTDTNLTTHIFQKNSQVILSYNYQTLRNRLLIQSRDCYRAVDLKDFSDDLNYITIRGDGAIIIMNFSYAEFYIFS